MSRLHLAFSGGWQKCTNSEACASPVHVEMSIEEAAALPEPFIEALAEIVDPPQGRWYGAGGGKAWYNSTGRLHRKYGLPALIQPDGARVWMRNGLEHRFHGLPAIIQSDGTRIWYQRGERHREGDKPALIRLDGSAEWWVNGKRIRREPEDWERPTSP